MPIFKQEDISRPMGNSNAAKNRLSRIFWLAMFVCLLPFVLLAFLNDMAADDFSYCTLYRTYGFFGAQGVIYHNWAGRYTTTFLNQVFVASGALSNAYRLPCLLLFAGTWG